MKVLFLDFDGVLNSTESARKHHTWEVLIPETLEMIRWIADQGVQIVVSSTWRRDHSVKELSKIIGAPVFGKTPVHNQLGSGRGQEIAEWLTGNDVERYAILDDDVFDMLDHQHPFIVNTETEHGMKVQHYVQPIKVGFV